MMEKVNKDVLRFYDGDTHKTQGVIDMREVAAFMRPNDNIGTDVFLKSGALINLEVVEFEEMERAYDAVFSLTESKYETGGYLKNIKPEAIA